MGFVEDFTAWSATRSDAPPQFVEAAALFTIDAVIGDRLRVCTNIDPDLQVNDNFFLVGATSSRKSWVVRQAHGLLSSVVPNRRLSSEHTPEAYAEELMEKRGVGYVVYDEFSRFFKEVHNKAYMSGLLEWYTDDWSRKHGKTISRKSGTLQVPRPFVSMLVATTDGMLQELLTAQHVSMGFLSRFNLVYAERGPRRPVGRYDPATDELRDYVYARMGGLQTWLRLHTPDPYRVDLSSDALEYFNGWATQMDTHLRQRRRTEEMMGSKVEDHALRLSLLYEASDTLMPFIGAGPREFEVSIESITKATNFVEGSMTAWARFAPYADQSTIGKTKTRILEEIERLGAVRDVQLLNMLDVRRRDFEEVLGVLEQAGLVSRSPDGTLQIANPSSQPSYNTRTLTT